MTCERQCGSGLGACSEASGARRASCAHLASQAAHVVRVKRRLAGDHLVEQAAERPDVGLGVVRLVLPQLRGHVVRSADLGLGHRPAQQGRRVVAQVGQHGKKREETVARRSGGAPSGGEQRWN